MKRETGLARSTINRGEDDPEGEERQGPVRWRTGLSACPTLATSYDRRSLLKIVAAPAASMRNIERLTCVPIADSSAIAAHGFRQQYR